MWKDKTDFIGHDGAWVNRPFYALFIWFVCFLIYSHLETRTKQKEDSGPQKTFQNTTIISKTAFFFFLFFFHFTKFTHWYMKVSHTPLSLWVCVCVLACCGLPLLVLHCITLLQQYIQGQASFLSIEPSQNTERVAGKPDPDSTLEIIR